MKLKKVYLLFLDTGSLLTKVINIYTKTKMNHTSIAFDPQLNDVYSFGRKSPRNPFIGGFVKEDLRSDFFKDTDCEIYSFLITEKEYTQLRKTIRQMEKSTADYRYNFIGLFAVMLNIEFRRKNAFFCSQFVATLLSECESYEINKPYCLVKPQDLKQWNRLQLIYKGKINHYPLLNEKTISEPIVPELQKVYS